MLKTVDNKIKGIEITSSWRSPPLIGVIFEKPLPDDFEPILIMGIRFEKEETNKRSRVEATEGVH